MDPVLAKRLAKQRAKEDGTLEAAGMSDCMSGTRSGDAACMDPKLSARLEQQRAKEAGLLSSVDCIRKSPSPLRRTPPASPGTGFDPVLQRRMAEQRRKEAGKNTAKDDVHSAAKVVQKLDPVLERRLAEQQRKLVTGASAVDEARLALKVSHVEAKDATLQRRMHAQREKVLTGEASFQGDIGSACGSASRVSNELAAQLELRRRKAEKVEKQPEPLSPSEGTPKSFKDNPSFKSADDGIEATAASPRWPSAVRRRTWFQQLGRLLRRACSRS